LLPVFDSLLSCHSRRPRWKIQDFLYHETPADQCVRKTGSRIRVNSTPSGACRKSFKGHDGDPRRDTASIMNTTSSSARFWQIKSLMLHLTSRKWRQHNPTLWPTRKRLSFSSHATIR
jgi:hypothetical protein